MSNILLHTFNILILTLTPYNIRLLMKIELL
nr:MAG TPA: hypothetical protein [Crassvirales sp.]